MVAPSANPPAVDRVRELLNYDPETGALTWRVSRVGVSAGTIAGSRMKHGYVQIMIDRRQCLAHRLAWALHFGSYPEKYLDHINGDRADNRISNLRECTHTQNNGNMRGGRNRTGYKGVYSTREGKYYAQIRVRGARKCLGTYPKPEMAHAAYMRAAQKYFGEFARAA